MRPFLVSVPICFVLVAGNASPQDLLLIDRLQEQVQRRFETPIAGYLGMSRITVPRSTGDHFHPTRSAERDFLPENAAEREIVGELENNGAEVGLYMFGTTILSANPHSEDYRALKGPAAITRGTPRPAWYPGQSKVSAVPADALPDWNAAYPLARQAMMYFQNGGAGFETKLAKWNIAARPVITEERCVVCHGKAQHLGGVLYAFRRVAGGR